MGRKVRVATDRLRPTFGKNSLQNKTFFLFLFTNFCSDISLEPWKNIRKCEIWKKIRITKKARAKRPYKLMLLEFFWRLCWSAAGGAAGVLLEVLLEFCWRLFWSAAGGSAGFVLEFFWSFKKQLHFHHFTTIKYVYFR